MSIRKEYFLKGAASALVLAASLLFVHYHLLVNYEGYAVYDISRTENLVCQVQLKPNVQQSLLQELMKQMMKSRGPSSL